MKKIFNFIYFIAWSCLIWGLIISSSSPVVKVDSFLSAGHIPLHIKWLMSILIVLLLIVIYWQIINSIRKLQVVNLLNMIAAAFFTMLSVLLATRLLGLGKDVVILLGIIFLLAIVALIVILASNIKNMRNGNTFALWGMTILLTTALCFTLCVPNMWGLALPKVSLEGSLLEYYVGQLSLTFITISVMSVLSEKSVIIYWENVAEAKLIKPLFCSFAAFTAYSIAATVGAGISVLLNNGFAFCIFFGANIFVLILLTLTMVDVYFGRERKKRSRAEYLRYVSRCHKYLITNDFTDLDEPFDNEYIDLIYNLQHHLYQEIEAHNVPYIREVAELYGGNIECFDTPEGQEIYKLLKNSGFNIKPMLADGVKIRVDELRHKHEVKDAISKGLWREDSALWATLARPENRKLILDNEVCDRLTYALLNRLTVIMIDIWPNYMRYNTSISRDYFARSASRYGLEKIKDYLDYILKSKEGKWLGYTEDKKAATKFLANILNLLLILYKNASPQLKVMIEEHQMAKLLMANEEYLISK